MSINEDTLLGRTGTAVILFGGACAVTGGPAIPTLCAAGYATWWIGKRAWRAGRNMSRRMSAARTERLIQRQMMPATYVPPAPPPTLEQRIIAAKRQYEEKLRLLDLLPLTEVERRQAEEILKERLIEALSRIL